MNQQYCQALNFRPEMTDRWYVYFHISEVIMDMANQFIALSY